MVKDISLSQNYLLTFVFLLEKLILPSSDAQPATEIAEFLLSAHEGSLGCHVPSLYVSTWNEGAGIMVLFISWIPVLHKTFLLLLCLGTGSTPLPSKRSPNLMEKEENWTFSMVIPSHMQQSTALSLKQVP